jgi:hypothetical protein
MSESATVARPEEPPAENAELPAIAAEAAQVAPEIERAPEPGEARKRALELIEAAERLPPALRERLAAAIATSELPAGSEMQLPLATVIAAVAEALPDFLRGKSAAEPTEHPSGEAFFSGAAGDLSDAEAEALAQQQLARAGLLRGQKVRVAD